MRRRSNRRGTVKAGHKYNVLRHFPAKNSWQARAAVIKQCYSSEPARDSSSSRLSPCQTSLQPVIRPQICTSSAMITSRRHPPRPVARCMPRRHTSVLDAISVIVSDCRQPPLAALPFRPTNSMEQCSSLQTDVRLMSVCTECPESCCAKLNRLKVAEGIHRNCSDLVHYIQCALYEVCSISIRIGILPGDLATFA
jgi:hypothetical protein